MATYIDMVVGLLLSFGLAFQMPLVVLALNKIGIMSIEVLKKWRRVVYFSMSIVAACIVPDVATGMIALLIPLILLYELGILLAQWSEKGEGSQAAVLNAFRREFVSDARARAGPLASRETLVRRLYTTHSGTFPGEGI